MKRRVGLVPESGAVSESLTGLEYLEMVAAQGVDTLERLFTQLTGGTELEHRAADFAKTFRP